MGGLGFVLRKLFGAAAEPESEADAELIRTLSAALDFDEVHAAVRLKGHPLLMDPNSGNEAERRYIQEFQSAETERLQRWVATNLKNGP